MRYGSISVVESLDARILFSVVSQTFQDGLNGYGGTEDTYVFIDQPTTSFGAAAKIQVDGDARGSVAGSQPAQGLIRFRNVFGGAAGQVPAGATVTAATLTLVTGSSSSDDSDSRTSLHRMLTEWGESSTWDSLASGISADGAEAASSADASVTPTALGAAVNMNVTAALQAWAANPASNIGWALIPGGTDGWWLHSAESTEASKRPRLTVTYETSGEPAVNQPPAVSAGPDLTVTLPDSASLNGTVSDDQLPDPPALITSWSQVSGPGAATFADPAAVDTTASFPAAGTYVLRLTAHDGELSASDDVTVVVNASTGSTFGRLDPISLSADTGEKPQSKVWEHAGSWWSVLPNSSGTWLWRLDGTKWTAVLKLSSTTGTKADVLAVGNVTHILLYKGSSSTRLASVEYVPGSPGTYRMWSSRPGLATVALSSGVETATLAIDGAGRMWVASDASTTIEVRHSAAPYSMWSSPITLASGTSSDDIAAIAALPNGSVGVLWSNQSAKRFGFRTHAPGASPSTWTANEVPASQSALSVGGGMADDHLNLAVASDGTLYAAVKTSYDSSGRPAIALLVRRPSGQWDNLYSVDGIGNTRPIVVLNEAAGSLRVFYTFNQDSGPGDIVYKESGLSSISFGARTTLMAGSFNNASSTRQVANSSLVVIAADSNRRLGGVRLAWPAPSTSMLAHVAASGPTADSLAVVSRGLMDEDGDPLSAWADTVEAEVARSRRSGAY